MRLPRDQIARIEKLAKQNGGTSRKVRLELPGDDLARARALDSPGRCVLVLNDYLPPLLNDLLKGRRRDQIRMHAACQKDIEAAAIKQRLPMATGARRVSVVVVFPAGRPTPDPDALFKSLGDALKHAKLLIDDRYELCEWSPVVYYRGDRLRTEVHLEDIPPKEIGPRPNGS